ncbi:CCA tRNA nucleotidyltransferase [SAR202 cluster bacterium AD-804-J14_MRT_500m]|nr:CCA tRNA nucleotidyltransferase [SAR202 cluster bacterium AD-804-J14_MRT_500m]
MLSNFEKDLPQESIKLLHCAIDSARALKIPIYLVGGPVRDLLLGRACDDLDLVVVGQVQHLSSVISDRLGAEVVYHNQFGTATIILDTHRLDLTTARKEFYKYPGSLPEVTAGSLMDDLHRRDFTINAMAIELGVRPALIVDPYGGRQDLEERTVNALHHLSFKDDPTRILRAIKFEQRLGFELGQYTEKWIRKSLSNGVLDSISNFRLQRELNQIFREHSAKHSIVRAGTLGFWEALFRPLGNASWINDLPERNVHKQDTRFISAVSYNLSRVESEEFIRRLDMPKNWRNSVRDIVSLKEIESELKLEGLSNADIYERLKGHDAEALAVFADYSTSVKVRCRVHRYLEKWRHIQIFLTGKDLIALGIRTGPHIREMIDILRRAHLNGNIITRQDESDLVRVHIKKTGG